MAVIICEYCGMEINNNTDRCINCGCPIVQEIEQVKEISQTTKNNDFADLDEIMKICGNNKVKAIAMLREKTGLKLKEAKNIIDAEYIKRERHI